MWIYKSTPLMIYLSLDQYRVLYDISKSYIFNIVVAVRWHLSLFRRSLQSKKRTPCVQTVSVCHFVTCYQRINFLADFNWIQYRKCLQSLSKNHEFRENKLSDTEILYLQTYMKICPHSPLLLTDFDKVRYSCLPHKRIGNFEFREKLVQWKTYFRNGPLSVT